MHYRRGRSDQRDNQNVKAFYRRGIAKVKLNGLDAANDLSAALHRSGQFSS